MVRLGVSTQEWFERLSPDSPELADHASTWLAAYLHLPFCARLCPYCDFAVVTGREDQIDRYLRAIKTEIGNEAADRPLDTVYLGGGTPSRLETSQLAELLRLLEKRFGLAYGCEISLEANPEDWNSEMAEGLVSAGFNRVSFGAQSFDDQNLSRLGRRHRSDDIGAAVEAARTAGFNSINLDLIFGSDDLSSWAKTVDRALELEPDHLSCYALTVEPGTELYRRVALGALAPDPDLQADQWELADAQATTRGLIRYEVSNWARPGHPVRYNLAVWAQAEYLGFGLGAHRFRYGTRSHNFRHLDSYLEAIETGVEPTAGSEEISGWAAEVERVFLGIRRAAGVAGGPAVTRLLESPEGIRLIDAGVVAVRNERLMVDKPLLTDAVAREVLALSPP